MNETSSLQIYKRVPLSLFKDSSSQQYKGMGCKSYGLFRSICKFVRQHSPNAYAEASQDKINPLAGSKCTNNFDDVSKFFCCLEASECLQDHNNFVDDLRKSYRGDNVVERFCCSNSAIPSMTQR